MFLLILPNNQIVISANYVYDNTKNNKTFLFLDNSLFCFNE